MKKIKHVPLSGGFIQQRSLPAFVLRLLTEFLPSGRELTRVLHHICKEWSLVPAHMFERQWQQRTLQEFAVDYKTQPTWASEYSWQARVDSNWLHARYKYSRTSMPKHVNIRHAACSNTHLVLQTVQMRREQVYVYSTHGRRPMLERVFDTDSYHNECLAIDVSSTWIYVGARTTVYCYPRQVGQEKQEKKEIVLHPNAHVTALVGNKDTLIALSSFQHSLFVVRNGKVEREIDLYRVAGYTNQVSVD